MTADEKREAPSPDCDELITPGGYLQKAREAKRWDVKEVAGKLRITRAKLAALESDSYDQFPGDTFIRGYFRSYARLLDLDEKDLLKRYADYVAAHSEVSQLIAPGRAFGVSGNVYAKSKPSLGHLVVALIAIALLAVVVWLLFKTPMSLPDAMQSTTVEQTPRPTQAEDGIASMAALEPAPAVEQPELAGDVPQAVVPAPVTAQAAIVENSPVALAPQPAPKSTVDSRAPDELVLSFADECWVEVSDANGDVLATELQSAGSRISLRGKAPFNVMLGNAKAVSVTLNGEPIDASPKGNNRALRFVVGQSS
jgi:cytoskeleton protein RodZ